MSNALGIYLRDHFAGSRLAVDLLKTIRDDHADERLAAFAADLLDEIEEDRTVLEHLMHRVGQGRLVVLKEAAAYVAEKLTWLKLRRSASGGLGTLQALETMGLGIQGKIALWRTLALIAPEDERLRETDFERLIARAESQFARLEERRLDVARHVLPGSKR